MSKQEEFEALYLQAVEHVSKRHVTDALYLMQELVNSFHIDSITHEYEDLKVEFNALLDGMARGQKIENAANKHEDLLRRTINLLNYMHLFVRIQDQNSLMAQCDDMLMNGDTNLERRFGDVATSSLYADYDWEMLDLRLGMATDSERRYIMSALLLSVWYYFNPAAIDLLAEFAPTNARAAVAIVIVIKKYKHLLPAFPYIQQRISKLCQNPFFASILAKSQLRIFMYNKHDEISRQVNQDIIPSLIEAANDKRVRNDFEESLEEEEEDEFEKMMRQQNQQEEDDPQLKRKRAKFILGIGKLFSFMSEGYDVNVRNFAHMVRNPFFNKVDNWFKPFNPHDPAIEDMLSDHNEKAYPVIKLMMQSNSLCDIDLYGFVLSMKGIKDIVSNHTDLYDELEQTSVEAEAVPHGDLETKICSEEEDVVNLLSALYRMCKMSKWKKELFNFFAPELNDIRHEPYVWQIFSNDADALQQYVFMLTNHNEIGEAYEYILQLGNLIGFDKHLLIQKALAEKSLNKIESATQSIKQVLMFMDSSDIHGFLPICMELSEDFQPSDRLEILLDIERIVPDDKNLSFAKATCLVESGQYAEALQLLYKLEYDDFKTVQVQRDIAWANMHLHKYEQALKYYRKLINTPTVSDWVDYKNAGHAAWLNEDIPTALTFYHQYIQRYLNDDPSHTNGLLPFEQDKSMLQMLGKSESQIDIMHDLISSRMY